MSVYYYVNYEVERIDIDELDIELSKFDKNKSVIIYGAGNHGRLICEHLENVGFTVECFCDNDTNKQLKLYFGKPVIAPRLLYEKHVGKLVIVSPYNFQQEIYDELTANRITNIMLPSFKNVFGCLDIPRDIMPHEFKDKYPLRQGKRGPLCKEKPHSAPILVRSTVYNTKESYLRRAIESVLNQTFTDFRYLIVDNGSTDGSASIIKEYADRDRRIDVIRNNRNLRGINWFDSAYGISQWNKIQKYLNTKYICILDSDDYYTPNFLESAFRLAELHDTDIVAGRTFVYNESDPSIARFVSSAPLGTHLYKGQREIADAYLDHNFICCVAWGKLLKTSLYDANTKSNRHNADTGGLSDVSNALERIARCNKFVMTDEIWHYHTWRDSGISKTITPLTKLGTSTIAVYNELVRFLKNTDAENARSAESILETYSFGRLAFDVELLEKSLSSQPELVVKTIDDILSSEIPQSLAIDPRMESVIIKLKELLNEAKQQLDGGKV